ncbi:M28 family metallopeptidase [Mycolicibacterium diernhoferi]|uniref:Amidohydrolase n=3 Tax=Mycolicibacterium diernhoferi TaxID=1801 RepID=A0A1Q4H413_9MYCO|nr:M28 family metallopeptidase [Mycolicibacterium diernhoferi]OJZ61615.1 amidohydrolase [Mycolicibacterium diernhoferi]PEG51401.1 amidohydrolase [Mycolicibacterium diernhoferi]QYL23459.1 M28 family peptidase [Mycolicibacterium diernhoferi]
MQFRSRSLVAVLSATALAVGVSGCGKEDRATPAPEYAEQIGQSIGVEAMVGHLTRLQEIADQHGGNRAMGTPGYQGSVDYVVNTLRDKGFETDTQEFEVRLPFAEEPDVTVGGTEVTAKPLSFTVGTGPDGVSGPLVAAPVDETPGCADADYEGLPVSGAVVLVDRGSCQFGDKQTIAAKRGAVALIVADNVDRPVEEFGGTLGSTTDVKIPVVSVSKAEGARLRANPARTVIKLKAGVNVDKTSNVIAQTTTGSTDNVVMVGAHLDSVPEGPGINDNGSGVAAVLETALQMGPSPDVENAVRFAFWGAEELGLLGSSDYVGRLDAEELKDIALYLNYDMIGSPNPGYFTYDGNQSAPPSADGRVPRVPEGSAGIERMLAAYLDAAGKPARDTSFDGRSDYDAFTAAGIPSGGLFSGAEENMTAEQAELWGGKADQPFDPNYHKKTDTLDQIDRTALEILGRGVGYSTALYAQDISGRNGVPVREDRTRHVQSRS